MSAVELPEQSVEVPVMAATGSAFTVTFATAVLEQDPLETVTVYEVLAVGETEIPAVAAPVFHEYVPPPEAVRAVELPEQSVVVPAMAAAGTAFTTALTVAVAVHPEALVTFTV